MDASWLSGAGSKIMSSLVLLNSQAIQQSMLWTLRSTMSGLDRPNGCSPEV